MTQDAEGETGEAIRLVYNQVLSLVCGVDAGPFALR